MTYIPAYLKTYPNMDTSSTIHLSQNRLYHGFRPHRHDFLEFSYVIDGRGSETINNVKHEMLPGTFTFVLPYQVHELFTEPGSTLVLYNCNFSMDVLMASGQEEALMNLTQQDSLPSFFHMQDEDKTRMNYLIADMYKEYNGHEPWRQTMLQIRLKEILACFDRCRRKQTDSPVTAAQGMTKTGNAIWPIISHIHRHYQDELALSELALRFSISPSRLSELIKQTTGQTFVHFVNDLRLRHACSLLVSTDMSVADIALEAGYGSYKTFSRTFREAKGLVPRDYRRQKQQQQDIRSH